MTDRDLALLNFKNKLRGILMKSSSRDEVMDLADELFDAGAAAEREECARLIDGELEGHQAHQGRSARWCSHWGCADLLQLADQIRARVKGE